MVLRSYFPGTDTSGLAAAVSLLVLGLGPPVPSGCASPGCLRDHLSWHCGCVIRFVTSVGGFVLKKERTHVLEYTSKTQTLSV